MEPSRQKTLDDEERVLPKQKKDPTLSPCHVKPRSRRALEVYDKLQRLQLVEDDPLFS